MEVDVRCAFRTKHIFQNVCSEATKDESMSTSFSLRFNSISGNTEIVLARVIEQLGKLASDLEGQAGRIFRDDHAEAAITEVVDVLVRNSQRRTFNDLSVCPSGGSVMHMYVYVSVASVKCLCLSHAFDAPPAVYSATVLQTGFSFVFTLRGGFGSCLTSKAGDDNAQSGFV